METHRSSRRLSVMILAEAIKPYTPEELGLCFTDAQSFLKSLEVREKNPAIAERLLPQRV